MAAVGMCPWPRGARRDLINHPLACGRVQVPCMRHQQVSQRAERSRVAVRAQKRREQSERSSRRQVDQGLTPYLMFRSLATATRILRETSQQLALRLKAVAVYLALRQAHLAAALLQFVFIHGQPRHDDDVDQHLLRPTSPVLSYSRPNTPVLERPSSRAGLSRPSTPVPLGGWGLPVGPTRPDDVPAVVEGNNLDCAYDAFNLGPYNVNDDDILNLGAADGLTVIPGRYPHLLAAMTWSPVIELPPYLKCLPGFPITYHKPYNSSSSGGRSSGRKLQPAYLKGKAPRVPIAHAPIPDVNRQQQVFPYVRKPDPSIQTQPASQEPIEACEGFVLPGLGVRVIPRVLHGTWDERPSVFMFADNTLYPSWSPLMHPSLGALALYKRPPLELVRYQTFDQLLVSCIDTSTYCKKLFEILLVSWRLNYNGPSFFRPLPTTLPRRQLLLPAAGGSSASLTSIKPCNIVNLVLLLPAAGDSSANLDLTTCALASTTLLLPAAGGSSASGDFSSGFHMATTFLLLPATGGSSASLISSPVPVTKTLPLLLPASGNSSASRNFNGVPLTMTPLLLLPASGGSSASSMSGARPHMKTSVLLLPAAGGSSASSCASRSQQVPLALPPAGASTASTTRLALALVDNSRLQLRLMVLGGVAAPLVLSLMTIHPAGPAAWPSDTMLPQPASSDAGCSSPAPSLWSVREPLALLPAAGGSSASQPCVPESVPLVMVTPESVTTLAPSQAPGDSDVIDHSRHNSSTAATVVVTCPDVMESQGGDAPALPDRSPAVVMRSHQTIGRKRAQEDRVLLLDCPAPDTSLMAVFDGHGGDRAAQWAKQEVPALVEEHVAPAGSSGFAALCSAFDATYEETFPADLSGTTAAIVYRTGTTLHVANLGDSPILLVDNSGGITRLFEKHNTLSRAECARAREAGALMARPRGGCVDRIWDVRPEAGGRGTMVTRSLGDLAHKRVPGVIAVPWVTSTELQPGHHVAAVALTDGITDVMSLDTVGKLVAEELAKGGQDAAFTAACAVVSTAILAQVHDNASVAVMAFSW